MSGLPLVLAANAFDTFVQTLFKALALGSLYALLALGFVLIYKATQTVNFAQGALALAGTWFLSIIFMDWERSRTLDRWPGLVPLVHRAGVGGSRDGSAWACHRAANNSADDW